MGNLVVYLCLLGADACLLCGYASLLRADSVYLCGYSLVLFCQCGVLTGYLFGGGSELFAQHFNLIVDVIDLLPWYGTVVQEFRKALTLPLQVGYLLANGRHLLLQIELSACRSLSVGSQLSPVCFEQTVVCIELLVACCQLLALQCQLSRVYLPHRQSAVEQLSFGNIEADKLSRRLCRHGNFRRFERSRCVIILLFLSARCHHKGKNG